MKGKQHPRTVRKMRNLRRFIQGNPVCTTEDMSNHIHLSVSRISHGFKTYSGFTPTAFQALVQTLDKHGRNYPAFRLWLES